MLFSVIMMICGALFAGIGLYAWKRKTPMHFWSGTKIKAGEISDVAAYNRANGLMWIGFSLLFWLSGLVGCWNAAAAGILEAVAFLIALPLLPLVYQRIYRKYKA